MLSFSSLQKIFLFIDPAGLTWVNWLKDVFLGVWGVHYLRFAF